MAQGNQNAPAPNGFVFSQEDLNAALARRGFRVHDGFAYGEKDGVLFKIVAPTSPDGAAHAYAEFVRNRIVANRNGVSANDAATAAARGTLPNTKSNDAFDSVYLDRIAELVDGVKGWTADVVKKMSDADKITRRTTIEHNASLPNNRAKYYDSTIRDALAGGDEIAPKRATARTPKKAGEVVEI